MPKSIVVVHQMTIQPLVPSVADAVLVIVGTEVRLQRLWHTPNDDLLNRLGNPCGKRQCESRKNCANYERVVEKASHLRGERFNRQTG